MKKANEGPIDDHDTVAYRLLLTCPSGFSPSQVSVVLDEAFDRIPHPNNELENSISEIWDQKVQQNASLFNGKKFRYGGYILQSGANSTLENHVHLHIGLTDYRTFVGTNLNPLWERFLVPSEDDCRQCQHTSSPLGNGAIVETSDKRILVLQRSQNVGEFPGHYVFPGGHPEPHEVGIASHEYEKDEKNAELINRSISQEMFDSMIREVVEEIGVPAESLHYPVFVGISRRVLNVRPTAFFFIKCSLPSEEVQQLYSSAQDGYESTQLYTVLLNDLELMAPKMPGCHQGGFALYKLMMEMKNKQL
ncbi:8-oxo-dGTP diphosphatase [Bertholletia excelsa]